VDGGDEDLMAAEAIEDDVRSPADDELAEIRFGGGVAEAGVELESFDEGDNAGGELLSSWGVVESDVGANLAQARDGEGRPDNLKGLGHRESMWKKSPQGLKPYVRERLMSELKLRPPNSRKT